MNEQKHTINRHVLELTVPDREHALSIQNNTASLVKNNLIPALDKLFSRLTTQDEILRIDRLVLDIGDISSTSLNEEMVSKTVEELEDKLKEIIILKRNQKPDSYTQDDDSKIRASFVSKPENQLEQLIHYLKFGVLPWWREEKEKLSLGGLIRNVAKEKTEAASEFILPLITFEQVRRRIAYQLDEQQFYEFFKLLPIHIKQPTEKIYKTLAPGKLLVSWEIEALFRYHFLELISDRKQSPAENEILVFVERLIIDILKNKSLSEQERLLAIFMTHFLKLPLSQKLKVNIVMFFIQEAVDKEFDFKLINVPGLEKILDTKDIEIIKKSFPDKEIRQKDEELIKPESGMDFSKEDEETENIESILKTEEKDVPVESADVKSELTEDVYEDSEVTEDAKVTEDSEATEDAEITKEAEDTEEAGMILKSTRQKKPDVESDQLKFSLNTEQMEIYINNAGLVLLHPFLFYFFNGLGLLNKDKTFKTDQATFKAVHLLQYVATGETASPEHELSLNKVLCGIDLNDPIPFDVALTSEEIEECKNLQSVVLERWEVLKTSNIEALTEGFLKREGILSYKGNGWNLYIERKTLDVMLDKLPWSLSIIKLPWRDDLIYVEW